MQRSGGKARRPSKEEPWGRERRAASAEELKRIKKMRKLAAKKFRAEAARRERVAIEEILAAYTLGWTLLRPEFRDSPTGIALGLMRQDRLTTYKSERPILLLLRRLAKAGKIELPEKKKQKAAKKKKK